MTYAIAVPENKPIVRKTVGKVAIPVWPRERYRVLDVEASDWKEALTFVEQSEGVKGCRLMSVRAVRE